jgi:anti-sigma regulatory factor (Ser/Thr protein kinase)
MRDGQEVLTLQFHNRLSELARLRDAAEAFAVQAGLPEMRRLDLQLVLEEAGANIIRHAWHGGEHAFTVRLILDGDGVAVELEDDGRPFDPLTVQALDINAPLEERRCGGMGVHLIRQLSDEANYQYHGGRNRLTLRLRRRDEATQLLL